MNNSIELKMEKETKDLETAKEWQRERLEDKLDLDLLEDED